MSLYRLVIKTMQICLPELKGWPAALWIFFSISFSGISYSQTYTFRHIDMRDGLPSNNITDILRDSRGFYWIATDAGLVKWHGNSFEVFGTEQGLQGMVIRALAQDNEGHLLIAIQGEGIVKFDGRDFKTIIPASSLPGSRINRMEYSAVNNLLLIASENWFAVYGNDRLQILNPEPVLSPDLNVNITGFLETDSFIYVLSHNNGLFRFFPGKGTLVQDNGVNRLQHLTTSGRVTEKGDTIWGLAYRNIYIAGKDRQEIITGIAEVSDYAEDQNGNILLASVAGPFSDDGGIFRLRERGLESLNELYGLEADRVTRVIFDHADQLIVISDQTKGIFVLYPPLISNGFRGLDTDGMNIVSIAETGDGNLWIADDKDIYVKRAGKEIFERFDTRLLENKFRKFMDGEFHAKYSFYLDPEGSWEKYQKLGSSGRYPYPNPYQTIRNDDTTIFKERLLYRPQQYEYLESRMIENINHLSPNNNSLWISTNVGFFKINDSRVEEFVDNFTTARIRFSISESDKIIEYGDVYLKVNDLSDPESSPPGFMIREPGSIAGLQKTGDGYWIICRNNGLFLFDGSNIRHMNPENEALASSLTAITADKRGNLAVGSAGGVIQVIGFENDSLRILHTIETSGNIIGRRIIWLETDNSGYLWAGTNLGVNRINLDRIYSGHYVEIRFFDAEEGYTEQGVRASFVDKEGIIWLGAPGMVARINSKIDSASLAGPRDVFLKRMNLDYATTDWHNLDEADKWTDLPPEGISLRHYNNNLSFLWDVTNIAGNGKTLFRYRILGLNDDWSPFAETRQSIYPNMRPGRYTIQVEAQLSYDESSRGSTEFTFRILPPWWQTWWFYTVSGIMMLAAFWIVLILRVRHIRTEEVRKLNQEREINELRIKALQAQMNPHFTFNALNSIQYFLSNSDQENAFRFIGYFAKLIRQTLEFAARSSVSIKEEAAFLENYLRLEQMRFENRFSFKITIIPPDLDSYRYQIPPMLLQPFVENAILHGLLHREGSGLLNILFEVDEENTLKCIVEDDGVGREKSAEINRGRHKNHKSMGLDITKRRIILLNQPGQNDFRIEITDLHDDNGKPSGTRVLILIPLNEDNPGMDMDDWD